MAGNSRSLYQQLLYYPEYRQTLPRAGLDMALPGDLQSQRETQLLLYNWTACEEANFGSLDFLQVQQLIL